MASPYGKSRGSGSEGSLYGKSGRSRRVVEEPKKKGRSGVLGFLDQVDATALGFVGNLGSDIGAAATGLVPGLLNAGGAIGPDIYDYFRHPLDTTNFERTKAEVLRPVAATYKQTYGPLAPGGRPASDFLREFYGHPLGVLLDGFTLVSFGAGAAVRTGRLSATQKLDFTVNQATRSRETNLKGKIFDDLLKGVDRANSRLPLLERLPKSEIARFGAEVKRLPRKEAATLQLQGLDYARSVRYFGGRQFDALHLIAKGIDPEDFAVYLEGKGVDPKLVKRYRDPKLRTLYDEPTPRLLAAADEARKLSSLGEGILTRIGWLDEAGIAERPYLTARLVSGAEFDPDGGGLFGGKALDAIRRDLADAGRPEPFYVPDRAVRQKLRNAARGKQGGGKGAPKLPGTTKRNKGVLTEMGMLALNSDLIGPEFLNRVKLSYFNDLHTELIAAGRKVGKSDRLREGEVFLRRRNERIPYTERVRTESEAQLTEGVPDVEGPGKRHFIADDPADALMVGEHRIAVPEQLAHGFAGEFTRSERATRYLLSNPTKVWRHLVLGLRVGFLVNNLVGNHLLYAIKFGGMKGLRAYLNMVSNTHGADYVYRMLKRTRGDNGISRLFIDELYADQSSVATFAATNRLQARPGAARAQRAAMISLLPATQALAETGLRRAAVETSLRRAPEVKAALRQLPAEQRAIIARLPARVVALIPRFLRDRKSFETASRIAMKENPALEQRISRQVNDGLGDYLSLNATERGLIRGVFPFYSWYKAITRISVKLALDNPLRTDILARLAEIEGDFQEGLGAANQGLVPAGALDSLLGGTAAPGTTTVFNTAGINPFATLGAIGAGAGSIIGANDERPGATVGSTMNPFAQALAEWLSGHDLYTDRKVPRTAGGLVGGVYGAIGRELPQSRLLEPLPASSVQPQRNRRSTFLAFLGVPVRRMDLDRVRDYERER